ncbi:hypothetical protein MCUN1_000630 [Malassezia cuniculi]|uniref:Nucleoporin n=1 Tax=Malassezia cuniculi TaxID=948313 RepID=A0AAF0J584_9BASI|nr:hypothetical protein MCUN1_000630 [Malassezia cuniculi]
MTDALERLGHGQKLLAKCLQPGALALPDAKARLPPRDAPYEEHTAPDDPWASFRVQRRLPIPAAVFETITSRAPTATLSLFPEIRRACISVDNRVYLWNYAEGSAAFEYHELPADQVVLAVGLVAAVPGVFVPSIKYVLVLATGPSALSGRSVVLLGVEQAGSGLRLYETGMSAATNGVALRSISGTTGGRIFGVGSDQSVYEVIYSSSEGWFTPRCYLYNVTLPRLSNLVPSIFKSEKRIDCIAVDSARNLLYVLRHGDQIDVYSLPSKNASRAPAHAGSMYGITHQAGLLHSASEIGHMVWLGPTEVDPRSTTSLVAVTDKGFRIYFDDLQRRSWAPLVVRAPPGAPRPVAPGLLGGAVGGVQVAAPQRRATVALYASGTFFVAFAGADGTSQLYCTGPSAPGGAIAASWPAAAGAPSASAWQESTTRIPLGAGASAPVLAEVSKPVPGSVLRPAAAQTVTPPRVFLVLDSNGLTEVVERRPVDVLAALLVAGGGTPSGALATAPPIVDFYTRLGPIEASMSALCLAAGSPHLGHAPVLAGDMGRVSVSDEVAVHAIRVFFSPLASWPADARMPSALSASKTSRHEALVCYVGCAVRDVWEKRIAQVPSQAPLRPVVGVAQLEVSLEALVPLHEFMVRHSQLFEFGTDATARDECSDLEALKSLVARTVQACRFVLFMHDHALDTLVQAVPQNTRARLQTLTFGELVASKDGRSVANDLVTALIDAQSGARASVDAIAEALQSRCASFCSADDVRRLKAAECIRNATQTDAMLRAEMTLAHDATVDRRRAIENDLQTSLQLLLASAGDMSLDRLTQTVNTYGSLGFVRGIISLALASARASDPDDLASVYRADGCPVEVSPRRTHYDTRRAMYALVLDALKKVDQESEAATAAAAADSRQAAAADRAASERAAAYELATASHDPLFHEDLYAWLLTLGLTDQLLELRTPTLEAFLAGAPAPMLAEAVPDAARQLRDLLWQFYVRQGDYLAASQTLGALAHSADFALRLDERIEYLALAVGNAKSIRASNSDSVHDLISFSSQLEEDLEVAQVQAKVRSALQPIDTLDMDDMERDQLTETIAWLDAELLDVTTLYRDVAEPFELLEEKLLLIHTSQYQDPDLVARIWDALIAREHNGAAGEHAPQAIAALVTDVYVRLGRSEIACPLDLLVPLLEQYAFEQAPHVAPGWAPLVLLQGTAPADVVFDVLRGLVATAPPPWNTTQGLGFLLPDLAAYLSTWVESVLSQPAGARTYFPAQRVDHAANDALLKLTTKKYVREGVDIDASIEQLQTVLQRIKRAF